VILNLVEVPEILPLSLVKLASQNGISRFRDTLSKTPKSIYRTLLFPYKNN